MILYKKVSSHSSLTLDEVDIVNSNRIGRFLDIFSPFAKLAALLTGLEVRIVVRYLVLAVSVLVIFFFLVTHLLLLLLFRYFCN